MMSWLCAIDHKRVGILYMLSALLFFLAGGMEAMVMRAQLGSAQPEAHHARNLQPDVHHARHHHDLSGRDAGAHRLRSVPGTAHDRRQPNGAASAGRTQFLAAVLRRSAALFQFRHGSGPDAGWFSYAPLSEKAFSPGPGLDYWALALLLIAGGSIGSAINLIVTIATERAPGMTMRLVPLFVWMTLVTSVMIVFALPALAAVPGHAAERPAAARAFLRSGARRRAAAVAALLLDLRAPRGLYRRAARVRHDLRNHSRCFRASRSSGIRSWRLPPSRSRS